MRQIKTSFIDAKLSKISKELIVKKKYLEASNSLKTIINKYPTNAEAQFLFGVANCHLGQYDIAIDYLIRAKINGKEGSKLKLMLCFCGQKYAQDYGLEKIIEYSKTLPGDWSLYHIIKNYYQKNNRIEEAIIECSKMLAIVSNDAHIYFHRAELFGKIGKLKEAISDIDEGLKLSNNTDDNYESLVGKGLFLVRSGKFRDAWKALKKYIQCESIIAAQLFSELGYYFPTIVLICDENDYDFALKICRQRIDENNLDLYATLCCGFFEMLQKNFNEAISKFDLAITMAPSDYENYFCKSFAYYLKNEFKYAYKDANMASIMDPGNSYYNKFMDHLNWIMNDFLTYQ